MKVPAQDKTVVRFEVAPRSIVLILATIALVWLAYQLWVVVLILVMALILAGTFNPIVEWMERRSLGRTTALVVLFIALALTTAAVIFFTVPPLIEQLMEIIRDAPATRTRLIALLSERTITLPLAHILQSAGSAQLFANVENYLMGYSSQAVRALGYGVMTLVLSFYLLADGKRTQGVAYAIVPREYHMRLARILQNMETIVGGYMRGQLFTSAAIGLFTLLLLVICRVPNALPLALFAGFVDVIPFVGIFIAIVPAVLAALPNGLPVAGAVLLALSVYVEFESRILIPRVYGQVLRLSSTAVILALVAGGILMGAMGALLALPITAGLLMILEELRVEMPGDDSVDRMQNARHAKTEATYEQMSAGTTPPEAGQIAKTLAADVREADLVAAAKHLNGGPE